MPGPGTAAGGDLWEPSRSLKRTVLALLLTPPACLLVFALAVLYWGPHRSAAFFVPLLAALVLSILLGWPMARKLRRQLVTLKRQRDAFYQEILHLSRAAGLGEVASGIAHDLNNPLAIIREEAGWVRDLTCGKDLYEPHTLEEVANSLAQIDFQVERSRQITRRLLLWGRDAAAPSEALDVNELLDKTLYLLESELQAADVRVVRRLATDLPRVAAEASELRQIFLNLMKNALDAMRERGGTLTLTTGSDRGEVRVGIADTGGGVPPSAMAHLFEPFFTTKPAGEGTGLGLPISRWIAEKLGGRIEVETTEGAGTLFRVVLPAQTQLAAER